MDTIKNYIRDSEVICFMKKHAIFYNVGEIVGGRCYKRYPEKTAYDMVGKMVEIHNFLHPQNPYNLSKRNVCLISQTIFEGINVLDESSSADLYKCAGIHTARLHITLDKYFANMGMYPTVYDEDFYRDIISLFRLMGDYNIVSKEVIKEVVEGIIRALSYIKTEDMGGVHGDIHMKNIVTDGQDVQLIDFDMIGYGDRLLDLAVLYFSLYKRNSLFCSFVEGYVSERTINLSWTKFKHICLLARVLCVCTNIDKCSNYRWLPNYIEKTSHYIKSMSEMPSSEIKRFFGR